MTQEEFITKWADDHKRIQEAIQTAHSQPSPETKQRLKNIEETLKDIVDILKAITKKLK